MVDWFDLVIGENEDTDNQIVDMNNRLKGVSERKLQEQHDQFMAEIEYLRSQFAMQDAELSNAGRKLRRGLSSPDATVKAKATMEARCPTR